MEVTRDLYSLNLLVQLIVLHCHILFCLAIAATLDQIDRFVTVCLDKVVW